MVLITFDFSEVLVWGFIILVWLARFTQTVSPARGRNSHRQLREVKSCSGYGQFLRVLPE